MDRSSVRAVAAQIGIPHSTLHSLLGGATPHADTLDKVEQWMEDVGRTSADAAENAEQLVREAMMEYAAAAAAAVQDVELPGMENLEGIDADDLRRLVRALADEAEACNTRSRAVERLSHAIELDAEAGHIRTRAVERATRAVELAEASAHARALLLYAKRTNTLPLDMFKGEQAPIKNPGRDSDRGDETTGADES